MEPVPNWLVEMAEAAGRTAFTDEFDRSGKEWKPFDAPVLLIGKLIRRYRHDGNVDNAGLKCAFSGRWVQNMRPGG